MKRKFFLKRFAVYFFAFFIPTFLLFVIAMVVFGRNAEQRLISQEQKVLESTDTNLSLVVNNIAMQNDLFTKNPYMGFALKNILKKSDYISYGDTIYLRSTKAMLRSVQEVYDYVSNINIYLNGYDRYYSSENGIQTINGDEYWLKECQEMEPETETLIMHHEYEEYRNTKRELTVYQRMLLMDGFVIMSIDLQAYENILRQAVGDTEMTILFVNSQQDLVIAYQDTVNIDSEDLSRITQKEDTSNWITINHQRYLIQKIYDEQCNLELIALLPQVAIFKELSSIYPIYFIVFALNTMIVIALAYITTKRNFSHLDDMIQIFSNAEKEIYLPIETTSPARDEYDILMKNIIYLFLQKVRLDKELETKKEEERIAEITALQAQINPHFLFNTLQSIQFEIRQKEGNDSKIAEITEELSDILKYALGDPKQQVWLSEEIQYLKRYVNIQKMRFGDKFILYYEIEENLKEHHVFRLLLQPIVENSILHGVRYREHGYIKIKIYQSKQIQKIIVAVIDSGIGMTKEELMAQRKTISRYNPNHVGLANVNCRLKLYYGEEAQLHIYSKKDMGTVVKFYLPLS
mgnify:FL=1